MNTYLSKIKKNIYLDNAAATPLDKDIAKKMSELDLKVYGNASALHAHALQARGILENARTMIAAALFAHSNEILFTGSGTESNALAIIGVVRSSKVMGVPHIVTSCIEHPAVLENCALLASRGEATITYIPVTADGIVDVKEIKKALTQNTVLVSIMYVNNEIGTIQPISEIAKTVRHFKKNRNDKENSHYPLFHTDACQAMNYLPTSNIEKLGVDLLSFNSSKIYGPKGIGILYKKRNVTLEPLYSGGGQEYGLRSGTENVSLCMGAALALEKTNSIKEKEVSRLILLRDYAIQQLILLSQRQSYGIRVNGSSRDRLPNNINISIEGISSELLVIELDAKGIAVSSKSACKSDDPEDSYVIAALRKAEHMATSSTEGSLRISLGRHTTKRDIDDFISALEKILAVYTPWKKA